LGIKVETSTLSIYLDFKACLMVENIKGLPLKSLIFFLGTVFESLRAGIIAIILAVISSSKFHYAL